MKQRDPKYDIMKGIGIILVVLGHCGMELGYYIIYMFHMPLFFYVSGRLHKDKPLLAGIKTKFTSLAVPYIIFFTICAAFDFFIFADDPEYKINPLHPQNSGGPLWFLFAMLWTYIAFLALNKYLPRYAFIICLLLSVGSYLLSIYNIELPLYLDSAASCLIFYAVGYYSRNFAYRLKSIRYPLLIILLASLYALYLLDFKYLHLANNDLFSNQIMENYALFIISALVGILMIEAISICILDISVNRIKAWICRLGELSLYIFALHLLVINLLKNNIDNTLPLYYIIVTVISIALSVMLGALMEKRTNGLIKTLNSKW